MDVEGDEAEMVTRSGRRGSAGGGGSTVMSMAAAFGSLAAEEKGRGGKPLGFRLLGGEEGARGAA